MTIEQLIYIIEISKCKSLSQAAQTLHISQAALSMSLNKIEEEFGNIRLFSRTNKGVVPTQHGIVFIEYAKKILNIYSEMQEYSSKYNLYNTTNYLEMNIAAVPCLYEIALSTIISKITLEYNNIDVYTHEFTEEDVVSFMGNNHIDVMLLVYPHNQEEIIKKQFYKNEYIFSRLFSAMPQMYMRNNHPLAKKIDITEESLEKYTVITSRYFEKLTKNEMITNKRFSITSIGHVAKLLQETDYIYISLDIYEYNNPYLDSGRIINISLPENSAIYIPWDCAIVFSKQSIVYTNPKLLSLIKKTLKSISPSCSLK